MNGKEALEKAIKTLKEELEIANDIIKSQKFLHNSQKLEQENAKFKSIIKILKDKIGLFIFESNNIHYVGNEYAVEKITQEQYELLMEVLKDE